jgi:RNA polymerase sigma-70 factor (ECF subfamily)
MSASQEVEDGILAALERADYRDAAHQLVDGYGPEVFRFLRARLGNETDAAEAFSVFLEDLWRGLPGFQARSSARVWAYTVARHAALRVGSAPAGRRERNIPLSQAGDPSALIASPRPETPPYLKTENKDHIAKLRDRLSTEDRTLLMLRVNRSFSWEQAARVFLSEESAVDDTMLRKEAARLRKRFQLLKQRLREMSELCDAED